MDLILKIKAWQLFLLMVIPLGAFILAGDAMPPIYAGVLLFLFLLVSSGWVYAVGMAANERLDASLKMQSFLFTLCFIIPNAYLVVFFYFFVLPLSEGLLNRPPSWMVPVHFTSVAAVLYLLWFTAKQFVTYREKRETFYIEYWGTLFGFWFGFIGVWFLQPRINRLLGGETTV